MSARLAAHLRRRKWQESVASAAPLAPARAATAPAGHQSGEEIDVVNFVKKDGRWLVANAMWTVEPGACDELRPADPGAIRPAD